MSHSKRQVAAFFSLLQDDIVDCVSYGADPMPLAELGDRAAAWAAAGLDQSHNAALTRVRFPPRPNG